MRRHNGAVFVDSHCHLTFPELRNRIDAIRADMAAARVDRALVICTTLEEFADVHALALRHDNFWASAGVHPDNEDVEEPTVQRLTALASLPKVVGIGETGLDYYRLGDRTIEQMEWQRERFRAHIRAARECGKPRGGRGVRRAQRCGAPLAERGVCLRLGHAGRLPTLHGPPGPS